MTANEQNVLKKLEELSQYIVEQFEIKVIHLRNVLDEKTEASSNDTIGEVASKGVKFITKETIPILGSLISSLAGMSTKSVIAYLQKKYNKKDASALSQIVFSTRDVKKLDEYKKVLVEVCYLLFYSFEHQFMNVTTTTGGETRAMKKLSDYIVNKILLNLIANDDDDAEEIFTVEKLIPELLTDQGIVKNWFDKIQLKCKGSKLAETDREIEIKIGDKPVKCSTIDLFTKPGVYDSETDTYYSVPKQDPITYGYRRLLEFVDSYTEDNKNQTDPIKYDYILNLNNQQIITQQLLDLLKSRDPKKMEMRIKEYIDDTKNELINILSSLEHNMDESRSGIDQIKFIITNNGEALFQMVMDSNRSNEKRFDEAQLDRDRKHQELLQLLGIRNSCRRVVSIVHVGNRAVVPGRANNPNAINNKLIEKEYKEFYEDFRKDF